MVKGSSITSKLTVEEVAKNNPTLDYTTPDLITLVISDSGILTPPGVADVLLSVFGGEWRNDADGFDGPQSCKAGLPFWRLYDYYNKISQACEIVRVRLSLTFVPEFWKTWTSLEQCQFPSIHKMSVSAKYLYVTVWLVVAGNGLEGVFQKMCHRLVAIGLGEWLNWWRLCEPQNRQRLKLGTCSSKDQDQSFCTGSYGYGWHHHTWQKWCPERNMPPRLNIMWKTHRFNLVVMREVQVKKRVKSSIVSRMKLCTEKFWKWQTKL